mmetsp:Transcript_11248/g.34938  ORF Transcript_11248/g.34938 Transcript_11248/m.34938 type:complete len:407 (-) Transcript_11248:423-1643(-)
MSWLSRTSARQKKAIESSCTDLKSSASTAAMSWYPRICAKRTPKRCTMGNLCFSGPTATTRAPSAAHARRAVSSPFSAWMRRPMALHAVDSSCAHGCAESPSSAGFGHLSSAASTDLRCAIVASSDVLMLRSIAPVSCSRSVTLRWSSSDSAASPPMSVSHATSEPTGMYLTTSRKHDGRGPLRTQKSRTSVFRSAGAAPVRNRSSIFSSSSPRGGAFGSGSAFWIDASTSRAVASPSFSTRTSSGSASSKVTVLVSRRPSGDAFAIPSATMVKKVQFSGSSAHKWRPMAAASTASPARCATRAYWCRRSAGPRARNRLLAMNLSASSKAFCRSSASRYIAQCSGVTLIAGESRICLSTTRAASFSRMLLLSPAGTASRLAMVPHTVYCASPLSLASLAHSFCISG